MLIESFKNKHRRTHKTTKKNRWLRFLYEYYTWNAHFI